MIKTLDNVYINMEDFSGFTIGYPNDSDFTVMAMKELVDNQTATIELGRYPSEKEAKDALKKMIEHQDDIKKAEFFGREEGFYYISNIFTMPKPSKNGKADVKRFMIEGREYKRHYANNLYEKRTYMAVRVVSWTIFLVIRVR